MILRREVATDRMPGSANDGQLLAAATIALFLMLGSCSPWAPTQGDTPNGAASVHALLASNPYRETEERSVTALPKEARGKLMLFVLAGQSNMSGRGTVVDRSVVDGIYLFGNDGRWKAASDPLDSCAGQIDRVSCDPDSGVGPGMEFARTLKQIRPDAHIGLIPCAKGASTIFEWERRLNPESLYGNCLLRMSAASNQGRIHAILFLQGEWDALDDSYKHRLLEPIWSLPSKLPGHRVDYSVAVDETERPTDNGGSNFPKDGTIQLRKDSMVGWNRGLAGYWGQIFADIVDGWRLDLERPDLPVILAVIGDNKNPKAYVHWQEVQRQQRTLRLPHLFRIETQGLELRDNVHFTTSSSVEIGRRFARVYSQEAH